MWARCMTRTGRRIAVHPDRRADSTGHIVGGATSGRAPYNPVVQVQIVSSRVGGGHQSVAQALREALLDSRWCRSQVWMDDLYVNLAGSGLAVPLVLRHRDPATTRGSGVSSST